MLCLNSNWWTFIKERFPPLAMIPMIFFFVGGNGVIAQHLTGAKTSWLSYAAAFVLALSFFLRLRFYDEIKDYETDLKHNPQRPLARGVLTPGQVWNSSLYLIAFEVILAGWIGIYALFTQLVAIGYSLLMYKEFFIGKWLRPHLTLYAITHTLVSAFLGYALITIIISKPIWQFPPLLLLTGLMNWSLFNLFEFARKTFAPGEERSDVESYSSLYGVWGALALSLSQALVGTLLAGLMLPSSLPLLCVGLLILLAASLYLGIVKDKNSAKVFRNMSTLFLLYFFAIMLQ